MSTALVLLRPAGAWALVPLVPEGSDVQLSEVRAVVAAHTERSTFWLQLVVRTSGERLILLVPLPPGGALDVGDPDWFGAVESASAPRILPPADALGGICALKPAIESTARQPRAEAVDVTLVSTLSDQEQVRSFVSREGLELSEHLPSAWQQHTGPFIALEYRAIARVPILIGLRLNAVNAVQDLEAQLERLAVFGPLPITLTSLSAERLAAGDTHIAPEGIRPVWSVEDEKSDYIAARTRLLDAAAGQLWAVEAVGQTAAFDNYYPDGLELVPSLLADFGERLSQRGYRCPDFGEVVRDAQTSEAPLPARCASGVVASAEPRCEAPSGPLRFDLDCGEVDDVSLALAGALPHESELVRQVGLLVEGVPLKLQPHPSLEPRTVKVYAASVDPDLCFQAPAPVGVSGGVSAPPPTVGGGGPADEPYDRPEPRPEPTQVDDPDGTHHTSCVLYWGDENCSGSSSGSGDAACSGDSSSHSDDSACSGDSSSSSDGGETCAGDSSSESGGGAETCSGSATAEPAGDTCTGDGSSASGDCSLVRYGLPRPRLSALTILVAACVLPWRRRSRRTRQQRCRC